MLSSLYWQGHDNVDLLQIRHILPPQGVEAPQIRLRQEHLNNAHCSPDIFRCTLTKIPETSSLLQKSRLPLGVLIHPFKDLTVNKIFSEYFKSAARWRFLNHTFSNYRWFSVKRLSGVVPVGRISTPLFISSTNGDGSAICAFESMIVRERPRFFFRYCIWLLMPFLRSARWFPVWSDEQYLRRSNTTPGN